MTPTLLRGGYKSETVAENPDRISYRCGVRPHFPQLAALKPVGDLFIRLIKMLIAPMVFASLVVGASSIGDLRKLGRVGGKTVAYF